jgi:RNA polymerase primary sigma factor
VTGDPGVPDEDGLNEPSLEAGIDRDSDLSPDDSDAAHRQVRTEGTTSDPVENYLEQVGKVAPLTAEQEVELAKRIEAGLFADESLKAAGKIDSKLKDELWWISQDGKDAKDHLIEANLRLVVPWAKLYSGRGVMFTDLIQEGNLGLIYAITRFDYTKGVKFPTFAKWWIHRTLARAMADQARTIRISVDTVQVLNKLVAYERWTKAHEGRQPSVAEIAAQLDLAPQKVVEIQNYRPRPVSLHELIPTGWDEIDSRSELTAWGWATELGYLIEDSDALPPGDAVKFMLLQEHLYSVLGTLSEREAAVISMRYGLTDGEPRTLEEIGRVYGLTRERIAHIHSMTIAKLRHPSRSRVLQNYLDLEVLDPPLSDQPAPTSILTWRD